jgi:methylated-DNA-[protein]-cysteine S-methyltransferase
MELLLDEIETPIGGVLLVTRGEALCALDFEDCRARMMRLLAPRYGPARLRAARDPNGFATLVRAYFEGELGALERIAVDTGGTPFQRRLWAALRGVAPGSVITYGELAASIGRPRAARAAGATSAANPVALVVPCHRAVGARGALTGYAGGLERKRWLLEHEGALPRLLEAGARGGRRAAELA